jgi:lysophospholipase L1-like esterase
MVKTSRDSFLKVKEVQDDLDAISLLGEKGLTPNQIADSIEKINGLQASASEIDGSMNRDKQTMVILGDSLTAGNTIGTDFLKTKHEGQIVWANHMAGNPFDFIYNAGIGGETSSQILARVDADVIDKNPSHCWFLCGMNDTATDTNEVQDDIIKNNIIAIYNKLNTAGIYSFIVTNTTTTNNQVKNNQALNINSWIKSYFDDKPNCEVIDLCSMWINKLSLIGAAETEYMRDSIHPSNKGAFLSAIEIANNHFSKFKSRNSLPVSVLDSYVLNAKSKQLITNPLNTGNAGYVGSGNTGEVSTGHYLYRLGTASSVASKESREDGLGEYQVLEITSLAGGDNIRLESKSTYIPKAGDKVFFEIEVVITSSTNLRTLKWLAYSGTSTLLMSALADTNGGSIFGLTITDPISLVIKTPIYTFSADSTAIFSRFEPTFNGAGSATIKIGRIGITKVI